MSILKRILKRIFAWFTGSDSMWIGSRDYWS